MLARFYFAHDATVATKLIALTKIATGEGWTMLDENNGKLSDEEKIDRAARHEELRFYKKQQWAVATAGVILLGALLTTAFNVHITALDKLLILILIALALSADWFVLDKLEEGIVGFRRTLGPADAVIHGREISGLLKFILVASGLVVAWAVVFKLPL
jgi:hypothetical protein